MDLFQKALPWMRQTKTFINISNREMTQEEKDLLLKDLCARLPYGVKMNHIADDEHSPKTLIGVAKDMITLEGLGGYECVDTEDYKPYLFPLSSMTKEQKKEYAHILVMSSNLACSQLIGETTQDWFNKNHFDYRGLIPMGLAIDATDKKIY